MLDKTQSVQEMEYEFPYHYLPDVNNNDFTWWPYWDWGYKYLSGIAVILSELEVINFSSLLDMGCGDGRFLRELRRHYNDTKLLGIDYSGKAIRLANSMNPHIEYKQGDINSMSLSEKFDVVTLIEVLEHIPPDQMNSFIKALSNTIGASGILLVTVPHKNQKLIEKHYQHFDSRDIKKLFEPYFIIDKTFYFDKNSKLVRFIQRLIFNKFYIVRYQKLLSFLYSKYCKHYLVCDESSCLRLGVIMRLK